MNNPFSEINDKNFLIYLAQKIDNHYLPEGERLLEIAEKYESRK